MKDLKAMAAERAHWQAQCGHEMMIDIIQQIRNKFTNTELMDDEIEHRIKESFTLTRNSIEWLRALKDENV